MNNRIKLVRETLKDSNGKKLSQTRFAEEMHVTRDMVATYESGRVEPAPLFISSLCDKYNINEDWLRTGEGEMFNPKTRAQEVAEITKPLLKGEDDSFIIRVIRALSRLTPEQLELLDKIAEDIVKQKNSPNN